MTDHTEHILAEDPDAPRAERRMPETSPAWELELIISGAIVVALFQLPGLIANLFGQLEPHATESTRYGLTMLHTYVLAAAYAMIVVFTVHLASRAYWVALIGLDSVFPGGIDWSKMWSGPVARAHFRKRLKSLPERIERIDNFCSIAFSFAFLLVTILAFSIALVGGISLVAWLVSHFVFGGRYFGRIASIVIVAYLLPLVGLTIIDRRLGRRAGENAEAPAWLRQAIRRMLVLTPSAVTAPMQFTLTTNLGRRRFMLLLVGALYVMLLVAFADQMIRRDQLSVNAYDYFALSPAHGVDFRFYASERPDGTQYDKYPLIQSDIVADRYVKLFVPYIPFVDNVAIAAACPRVAPLATRGLHLAALPSVSDAAAESVLACLTTLHAVTLDGARIAQPGFAFYEMPHDAVRGIIAYLPIDSLAPGRHVLTVLPSPVPDDSATTPVVKAPPPRPYVIPFWK